MDEPTLYRLLGENLAEPLLRHDSAAAYWLQQGQQFDSFGAFFAQWQHSFVLPHSTPERMAESIVRLYLHRQLSRVVQAAPVQPSAIEGYLQLDRALSEAVRASWPALLSALQQRWPRQWADIVRRHAARR